MNIWGSVEAFIADPEAEKTYLEKFVPKEGKPHPKTMPKPFKDYLNDTTGQQAKFAHNLMMMSLIDGHSPPPEKITLLKGDFDYDGFKSLCHELAFSSIYRDSASYDNFVAPFRKH